MRGNFCCLRSCEKAILTAIMDLEKWKLKFQRLPLGISPKWMVLVMAGAIFSAEALVMLILSWLTVDEFWLEALLDSTILLLILTPVYVFFYRPFWEAQRRHDEQIRYLSQQLIATVEDERKRITSELHDQSGQSLTALQFGLQTLKRCLETGDRECLGLTETLVEQTSQLSDNLRTFASRLRPETLDQLGLIAALEVEFREFARTYRQIELSYRLLRREDLDHRLGGRGELAIYRICQEALTNIAKHSQASEVVVYLKIVADKLVLQIEDNGCGFDVGSYWTENQVRGIGLLGMRERVSQLGGRFDIDSAGGRGTRLTAEFPLRERLENGTD